MFTYVLLPTWYTNRVAEHCRAEKQVSSAIESQERSGKRRLRNGARFTSDVNQRLLLFPVISWKTGTISFLLSLWFFSAVNSSGVLLSLYSSVHHLVQKIPNHAQALRLQWNSNYLVPEVSFRSSSTPVLPDENCKLLPSTERRSILINL